MKRLVLMLTTLLLAGCLQPADPVGSSIPVAGQWRYVAQQGGTSETTISGTMTIEQGQTSGFQGSLDAVVVTTATGESRNVAATLSGTASSDAVDFDLFLEQQPRRHVARLVGNVLNGTWIRLSADGTTTSGSFTATRLNK
jgi:hypothetical protein